MVRPMPLTPGHQSGSTLYEQALAIAAHIHTLANEKEFAEKANSPNYLDEISFTDHVASLEYRIHSLKSSSNPSYPIPNPAKRHMLFVAFALASLIYVYSALRDFPENCLLLLDLQHQLEVTIGDVDYITAYSTHPEVMVWVLLVGGSVPRSESATKSFSRLMMAASVEIGFDATEDGILGAIGEFPWRPCKSQNGRALFWETLAQ